MSDYLSANGEIWKAIDDTLQEMLQPFLAGTAQTPPAAAIVLARLTKAVYQAALRCGFRGTFADVEFGLWDAFHTGNFAGHFKDLLPCRVTGRQRPSERSDV
jgi:hypothetical protein